MTLLRDPSALLGLSDDVVLAIDTEFHAESRYIPALYLIQVCAPGHEPWLIDPRDRQVMQQVGPCLKRHPWLLHAGATDLVLLERALGGVPAQVWDTQIAAGLVQCRYPAGLGWLIERYLGVKLAKSQGLSDWSKRPLTAEQLAYAAEDVSRLHALWDAILAERPERRATILQACDEARAQALAPADLPNLWRDVPGRHGLSPTQTAVLQALVAWREQLARDADQPPGAVLNTPMVLQIAKKSPTDLNVLMAGRRTNKKVLAKYADALLEVVEGALSAAPTLPAAIEPGTLRAARLAWLQAFAETTALEQGWSARLVAPSTLLEDLVDGRVDGGWRGALLAPHLDRAQASEGLAWPR